MGSIGGTKRDPHGRWLARADVPIRAGRAAGIVFCGWHTVGTRCRGSTCHNLPFPSLSHSFFTLFPPSPYPIPHTEYILRIFHLGPRLGTQQPPRGRGILRAACRRRHDNAQLQCCSWGGGACFCVPLRCCIRNCTARCPLSSSRLPRQTPFCLNSAMLSHPHPHPLSWLYSGLPC